MPHTTSVCRVRAMPQAETQLSLLDEPTDLERRYQAWITANPQVLPTYERVAKEALTSGKKFSISLLTERIRWECHMQTIPDDSGFKINNDYRAYIARDLIQRIPKLADVLELRVTKGEKAE